MSQANRDNWASIQIIEAAWLSCSQKQDLKRLGEGIAFFSFAKGRNRNGEYGADDCNLAGAIPVLVNEILKQRFIF